VWSEKFSVSTIVGNTIGKIFFALYKLYMLDCWHGSYMLICVCGRLEYYIMVFDRPT